MTSFGVFLPWPPSTNNLFTQGYVKGRMRRFPTRQYKKWRFDAVVIIRSHRPPRLIGNVKCTVELRPPNNVRRDADNYNKAILDALVEARVLHDDSQVTDLIVRKTPASSAPGAFVTISNIEGEQRELPGMLEELQESKAAV